ncbi:MAG: NTP transferase domain-containing protein [Dissulfurimicrobium sp.]|uniref:NTP transferase domain-containing protein n=1 Tax=Dissulfurimicrobium sp. TaxID=2022436 RepID=UPI0040499842
MQANDWAAIVLAAGKGTRMKSDLPKVMHNINGQPIIFWVIDLLKRLDIHLRVVVIGYKGDIVRRYVEGLGCQTVEQKEQLGTGHAVMCARSVLDGFKGNILIMCGDTPLFKRETIDFFMQSHIKSMSNISILTALMEHPFGYGRIKKTGLDDIYISGIVEEKDASNTERKIKEINTGVYAVKAPLLFKLLEDVGNKNAQGEFYLTDIVGVAVSKGEKVRAICCAASDEAQGINSKEDMAKAKVIMSKNMSGS